MTRDQPIAARSRDSSEPLSRFATSVGAAVVCLLTGIWLWFSLLINFFAALHEDSDITERAVLWDYTTWEYLALHLLALASGVSLLVAWFAHARNERTRLPAFRVAVAMAGLWVVGHFVVW